MNKFVSFVIGFLVCLLILGAVGFWLVVQKPQQEAQKGPVTLELPAGKGAAPGVPAGGSQERDLPKVTVAGQVELAPHVLALTAKAKKVWVRVLVNAWDGGVRTERLGSELYENPKWPLQYVVNWKATARQARIGKEDLGVVNVHVAVCLDAAENNCNLSIHPRTEGRMRTKLTLKGGIPSGKGNEVSFKIDPIIVNKVLSETDPVGCEKGGNLLSGQVLPSPSYLAAAAGRNQAMLVMLPYFHSQLGNELAGPTATRPSPQVLTQTLAGGKGVAIQKLALNGSQAIPFSMKIPAGMEGQRFQFFAATCNKGEDELSCASKVFPFPEEVGISVAARDWYMLVPKGFTLPYCGQRGVVLHLNHNRTEGVRADVAAYRAAGNQPEFVEGVVF